jgi:hypothetical protein
MTELDKGQKADRRAKKYLWFGYGNYTAQGNLQIPAGDVRAPDMMQPLSEESKIGISPLRLFAYTTAVVVGVMLFVMLLAWVFSLIVG